MKTDMKRCLGNLLSPVHRTLPMLPPIKSHAEEIVRGVVACGEKAKQIDKDRAHSFAMEWAKIFARHDERIPRDWAALLDGFDKGLWLVAL